LHHWVEEFLFSDFQNEAELLGLLHTFVRALPDGEENELNLLLTRKKPKHKLRDPTYRLPNTELLPWAKMWSPTVFGQQLTLQIFQMFKAIQPFELLNQNWQRSNSQEVAPILRLLTNKFNEISFWIATEIIMCEDKSRVATIMNTILILEQLFSANDFFSLMAVLSGLDNSSVARLSVVWEQVPERFTTSLKKLQSLMSPMHNFVNYRNHLKLLKEQGVEVPIMPHLVVILKDLTFINDGNKDYLETPKAKKMLPNFEKMMLIGAQILELRALQNSDYGFPVVEEIQMFLTKLCSVDEEALYNKSVQLQPVFGTSSEPKEREKVMPQAAAPVTVNNPLLKVLQAKGNKDV